MRESKQLLVRSRTLLDTILDGLFGGLLGGGAMALYLILWRWVAGRTPGNVLGLFDGSMQRVALTGALAHLAVSAVYGIVFGLIWRIVRLRIPGWVAGIAYGLALLMIAQVALLPVSGSPLAEIPRLHFALAHIVYGAVLGVVSERIGAASSVGSSAQHCTPTIAA